MFMAPFILELIVMSQCLFNRTSNIKGDIMMKLNVILVIVTIAMTLSFVSVANSMANIQLERANIMGEE